MDGLSNGILALRRGGRGGKKSAKFKKQAKKRYDDRKANVREQARSNQGSNDNKKKTTTVLSPLEALIANKDELVQQDGGDGVRNQYQVEMNNFKKGLGAYADMDSKKNKQAYKERFPNPFINIAKGIGDLYSKFSPMANIARALNAGNNKVKNFGPVKDATNMAKDLAGMFGLDGLMGKLVNIAGGRDNNQFNEVIKNNQTSMAMRNNLAYNDPRGLNNAAFYEDKILRDLQRQNSVPDPNFTFDENENFSSDTSTDQQEQAYQDKRLDDLLKRINDKEEIENSPPLGQFNFNTNSGINLGGDPDEVFEDVSETEYVNPNDVINQGNITTGFSDIPLTDPSGVYTDGTPMYNDTGELDQDSLDILNSNSTEIPDYIRFGRADGGYMNGFPNQNMGTQSLTASDNIDNRIMQNLQFERMAPGMMGYNQGGEVSPVRLNEGGPPNVTEILSNAGTIFFVKGDDVIPTQISKTIMIDEYNPRPINIEEGTGGTVKKLIDDGYELAVDDGSAESKKIRQLVENNDVMRGRSFTPIDINDDGVGRKLFNGIKSIGGKIGKAFPALGVLDIFDAKNQYDQLMDGTHPMSDVFNEAGIGVGDKPTQVYNQGGKVMSTFEKLKAINYPS